MTAVIELIDPGRCTNCNICIRVCPTDVFDRSDGTPKIARQDVCQTCFMCEVFCPEDAMYVAPMRQPAPVGSPHLDSERLLREGYFGTYRARLGWGADRQPPHTDDEVLALSLIGPQTLSDAVPPTPADEPADENDERAA
jgi:NAD-dependent dihydropyrimidine dehydrogenase PreA subunit